jgi:hypothetical protein
MQVEHVLRGGQIEDMLIVRQLMARKYSKWRGQNLVKECFYREQSRRLATQILM